MAPLGTKVVVALVVTGSVLGAQEKQTPPPPAAPRPFTLPKTQEITLANGMKVTLVPYGTLPLVTASVTSASRRQKSIHGSPQGVSTASRIT